MSSEQQVDNYIALAAMLVALFGLLLTVYLFGVFAAMIAVAMTASGYIYGYLVYERSANE